MWHQKQRSEGRPVKFEDAKLKELLDQDSCLTQEELTQTQEMILNCHKAMGMMQKQGNWVPHELKP